MNLETIEALPTGFLIELKILIAKELAKRKKKDKKARILNQIRLDDCDSFDSFNQSVAKLNYRNLMSLPYLAKREFTREKYYSSLVRQDWSHLFDSANYSDEEKFYVYAHVDPDARFFRVGKKYGGCFGGLPFYIGKGCGKRAYDLKRNQGHGKKLRTVLSKNWEPSDIVFIVKDGLSEAEAYELESKLIYFFGTKYQEDRPSGTLYNLDVPPIPVFEGVMQKLVTRKQYDSHNSEGSK